jgi:hypothetical protein
MLIPNKLKIGGHVYKVQIVESEDIDDDFGWRLTSHNIIRINQTLPQTTKEATLFHEILHVINNELPEETVEFLALYIKY